MLSSFAVFVDDALYYIEARTAYRSVSGKPHCPGQPLIKRSCEILAMVIGDQVIYEPDLPPLTK